MGRTGKAAYNEQRKRGEWGQNYEEALKQLNGSSRENMTDNKNLIQIVEGDNSLRSFRGKSKC